MTDTSRRDVLKAVTATGIGGVTIGATGTATASPGQGIINDILGTSDGSDTDCAATVSPEAGTGTHSTIQGAIDDVNGSPNADPADPSSFTIICIREGTYEENLTVHKPGIALASTDARENTVITADGTVVDSVDEWTVVFDLTLKAETGTAVDAGTRTVVQQSNIVTSDTIGIDASNHVFPVGNNFNDIGSAAQEGIGIRADGIRGDSESCGNQDPNENNGGFISRNTFTDHRMPLRIKDCTEILVRSNTFNLGRYAAVYVESSGTTAATECIAIQNNRFNRNANGVILFENPDGGRIKDVQVTGNSLDNFVYGVLTSHQKVGFDFDNDGQDEQVEAPGELRGGVVRAPCNWWDDPRGPNASGNEQQSASPVPNWVIPRQLKQVTPGPDKTVEAGVDYRPWAIQPQDPENETVCVGGEGTGAF